MGVANRGQRDIRATGRGAGKLGWDGNAEWAMMDGAEVNQ